MNVLVLGCGLVGRPMAIDLANDKSFNVTVADINLKNLKKKPLNIKIYEINKKLRHKILYY